MTWPVKQAATVMIAGLLAQQAVAQDVRPNLFDQLEFLDDGTLTDQSIRTFESYADQGLIAKANIDYIEWAISELGEDRFTPNRLGLIDIPGVGRTVFVRSEGRDGEVIIQSVDPTLGGISDDSFDMLEISVLSDGNLNSENNSGSNAVASLRCDGPTDIPTVTSIGVCGVSSVLITVDGDPECSGVLISSSYVLTAAHCACPAGIDNRFHNLDGSPFAARTDVVIGLETARDNIRRVVQAHYFPSASLGICAGANPVAQDIVLLELEEPFERQLVLLSDTSVATISAIGTGLNWATEIDKPFWHYGWGQTNLRRFVGGEGIVSTAQDTVVRKSGLTTTLQSVDGTAAYFFEVGKGICSGDSGGGIFRPLGVLGNLDLTPLALVGIVSGRGSNQPCYDGDSDFIGGQPVLVERVDTPEIISWLSDITENDVKFFAAAGSLLGQVSFLMPKN